MEKIIDLDFGRPDIKGVAGVREGKETFENQVEAKLTEEDWQGHITIRFPESIYLIGSSFWSGFAEPLVKKVGLDGVKERVTFVTSSERLTNELYKYLI